MLKITIICLFFHLCSCNSAESSKGIVTSLLRTDYRNVEDLVTSACRKNNPEIADGLKVKIIEAQRCLHSDPNIDPMKKIDECTAVLKNQTTSCLDEKYLPQILIDFLTHYFKTLKLYIEERASDDEFAACSRALSTGSVRISISDCIARYDKGGIPATKDIFCDILTNGSKCILDAVNQHCNPTASVNQLQKMINGHTEIVCGATDTS